MFTYYFSILHNTTKDYVWVNLFILILFIIAFTAIILFTLLCMLDSIYRPNIPQYSFNKILDIICPILIIISPTIIILLLNTETFPFIKKVFFIIVIHVLIIIPVIYLWSKNRNWPVFDGRSDWKNPAILLNLSIALIYPLFWIILISLLRYLRLGYSINFLELIFSVNLTFIPYLILISITFWPYFSIGFFLLIKTIITIRSYFWAEFYKFLKGFHIYALRFNFYFKVSEILYKISFLIFTYIINHPLIYTKTPRSVWRRSLHSFYLNKKYIIILLLFCFLLEFYFFEGNIYFMFFVFFIYFLLNSLFQNLILFAKSKWAYDCCLADYTSFNWVNPKYPVKFWLLFPEFYTTLNVSFLSEKNIENIEIYRKKIRSNLNARERLQMRNLTTPFKNTFGFRIKSSYMRWAHVRWTHTTVPLHKGTVFFARTLWEKAFFLNHPNGWSNAFGRIEIIEKKIKASILDSDRYCYIQFNPIPKNISKISAVIENNFLTNFSVLKNNGVKIMPYSKDIKIDICSQAQDDAVLDFSESNYEIKKVIGIDQKAYNNPREGHGKVFSELTDMKYLDLLSSFEQELLSNVTLTYDQTVNITKTIQLLRQHYNNFEKLQDVWAKGLHHMPEKYIPPLKVPNNFALSDLRSEFVDKINKANLKFHKISDCLFKKNIPENIDYIQASLLFEDSQIQQLMKL